MKGKLINFFVVFLCTCIALAIIFVFFVTFYYNDGFTYDTWVNGVYCTGKSIDEVNDKLKQDFDIEYVTVTSNYHDEEKIYLNSIDAKVDYKKALLDIKRKQNSFGWIKKLFSYGADNLTIKPKVSFNETKLDKEVCSLGVVKDYSEDVPQILEIRYSPDEGYYLFDGTNEELNKKDVIKAIEDAFENDYKVSLDDSLFKERKPSKEMIETKKVWDDALKFFDLGLVYDMGKEKISIDKPILSKFIVFDEKTGDFVRTEDNGFYIDDGKALEYIDGLCDLYDTYQKPRVITTHLGEEKTINKSTYGTKLNKKAEEAYFLQALKERKREVHVPVYLYEGYVRGLDDIGDTLIEVDLTRQLLYYIENGEVKMTCDVVTGKPSAGRATPEMVTYVNRKRRKTVLRGEDYASFVEYWIAIYSTTIGLHDASWQKEFGGERYLTHGSRGCINMRLDDVKTLYDIVEVGLPVLVYK